MITREAEISPAHARATPRRHAAAPVSLPTVAAPAVVADVSLAPAPAATPAPSPAPSHRIGGLDALRGLAAFAVLIGHYTSNYHRLYRHDEDLLFRFPWAGYGVLLFFMISGFVILMSAERVKGAADFAWARFSRLYPAYWAAIAVTFAVLMLFPLPGRQPSGRLALVNLSMLQHVIGVGNVDGVYWTLHVELYFYAIIFVLLLRRWVRFTEFALLGLVALAAIDYAFFHGVKSVWADRVRHVLILDNAFAFLIGVMLYRSLKGPRLWHAAVVGACLVYTYFCNPRLDFYMAAAFTALMFFTTRGYLKFLEWSPLVFLGTISYALYLTHQNIGYVIIRAGYKAGLGSNLSIALATAAALALAVAITFLVERPAMALLRHRRPAFRWRTASDMPRAPLAAA